jgi:hypothetical protein
MERSGKFAKLLKLVGTDTYEGKCAKYLINTYQVKRTLANIDDKLVLAGQNPKLAYVVVTKNMRRNLQVVCIKWIYEDGKTVTACKDFDGSSDMISPSFNVMYQIVAEAMKC